MSSVLSLKEIRTSSTLKDQIRKLEIQIADLNKQMDFQKKVETKLREDLVAQKKDYEHLEKQFDHFAGLEADYEKLESELQMARLEKLIGGDKVENTSNAELEKAKKDLKKVQSELKELKVLDPQRLKRQVTDLKKKASTQSSENQSINKALIAARKDLKEATSKKESLTSELEARQKGTDFFWQSKDEQWQLFEVAQLLKGDDPKDENLPNKVQCLNTSTGVSYLSKELDENDMAVWFADAEIPEEVSIEAGKRHKKIASDAEDDE